MSLTPPKEKDEEDINYLYRVGAARWLYQNDRGREDSEEEQISRGLSHIRDKEYVDELFSGTANVKSSPSSSSDDL